MYQRWHSGTKVGLAARVKNLFFHVSYQVTFKRAFYQADGRLGLDQVASVLSGSWQAGG